MNSERIMPIQIPWRERKAWEGVQPFVPWIAVEAHEERAWANHGQTLARLAERGGLGPDELWAIVHDKKWKASPIPLPEMVAWIRSLQVSP